MGYRLKAGEPVEVGLRRVAADQIERALAEIDDEDLGPHDTVHRVRKRCKKLRGLLRLVRPALSGGTWKRENAALRDAQGSLSDLRDAEVRVETFDALLDDARDAFDDEAARLVGSALRERRRRERNGGPRASRPGGAVDGVGGRLVRFRASLERVDERAERWSLAERGFDAVRDGAVKTCRRARRAMVEAQADGSDEAFHEWRKRVKYHGHHVRLLRETWSSATEARRRSVDRLARLLGDEHDLAVLRQHLLDHPVRGIDAPTAEAVHGLIAARRARLRREALLLGLRLFAEPSEAWARRVGVWFDVAWSDDVDALLDDPSGIAPPGPWPMVASV